jgi:hypothetical protein
MYNVLNRKTVQISAERKWENILNKYDIEWKNIHFHCTKHTKINCPNSLFWPIFVIKQTYDCLGFPELLNFVNWKLHLIWTAYDFAMVTKNDSLNNKDFLSLPFTIPIPEIYHLHFYVFSNRTIAKSYAVHIRWSFQFTKFRSPFLDLRKRPMLNGINGRGFFSCTFTPV